MSWRAPADTSQAAASRRSVFTVIADKAAFTCRVSKRTVSKPAVTRSAGSHCADDLRIGVQRIKDANPAGVLLGSGKLATELDRLDLIDEYKLLVHPRIAGHGPTLYQGGLPRTRKLDLISAKPLRSGAVAVHYRRES